MYLTWLDSNSWLIELDGKRILLDPWLVGPMMIGNLPWLFKSDRPTPRSIPDSIDLILLSQGLEDHAHPETLKVLDRSIPVVASVNAAKVVQAFGYQQVTALAPGESFTLGGSITIQALPGSSIGPMLVENAYFLRAAQENVTLYYEPHGFHAPELKALAPIDVVITPLVSAALPLVGEIIKGQETALALAKWVQPQVMLPTAAGGDITFEGIIPSLLKAVGSLDSFRTMLAEHQLSTRVLDPKPGDRLEIPLAVKH